jgi:hypothetical protein
VPRDSASIYITKLAAAQRQLDAAIRMVLQDEDELAVHTLVAAAYRILRDLKAKRGRNELSDNFSSGLFYVARDLAIGKLQELPSEIAASDKLASMARAVAAGIQKGDIRTKFDVDAFRLGHAEGVYWRAMNAPANFLKHADSDSDATLALDNVNNDYLLLAASVAYIDLIGQPTPEIQVYTVFRFIDEWAPPWLSESKVARLRSAKPALRRRLCYRLLRDFES